MTAVPQQAAQAAIPAAFTERDAPFEWGAAFGDPRKSVDPGAPAFVWHHPAEGLRVTAYGEAARREGPLAEVLPDLEAAVAWPQGAPEPPGPWFGALAFDSAQPMGPSWRGFAPARWTLPALLCWSRGGRHFAAAFGEGCEERLRRVVALDRPAARGAPARIVSVGQPGDRARWDALVARALSAIGAGALDKVVLARAIGVEADRALEPAAILAALASRYPSCRTFLLRGDGGAVFLGATPETFCRIDGALLRTEALAGSSRPGEGRALLGSQKNLREHRWVVEHIVRGLGSIAGGVQRKPEPELRELSNVAHLVTPIGARLAQGRSVADVVAALHPTPAVAGVPTAAALRFLAQHEPLERGLYAGLVGFIGPGRADLSVALRSALVRGQGARLFVGAGIVDGSSAEAEWDETSLKARALLDALAAPAGAAP